MAATSRAEALEAALRAERAAHASAKATPHSFQEESASLKRQVKAHEARPMPWPQRDGGSDEESDADSDEDS